MGLLHEAVLENSEIKVQKLLKTKNGLDINSKDEDGNGAIHIACSKGNLKIIQLLIKHGAKIDLQSNAKLLPPDLNSAYIGDMIPIDLGLTPLMIAVINKRFLVVRFLLENGANIDQQFGKHGQVTPLTKAIENGDLEMVKLLVQNGANINLHLPQIDFSREFDMLMREHYTIRWGFVYGGGTALFAAIRAGNIAIIKFLVENGANVRTIDPKTQENALGLAIEWYTTWKTFKKVDKIKDFGAIVKILVENGHDLNQFSRKHKFCPLKRVINAKARNVAEYMIKKGANVNCIETKDDSFGTRPPPLFWAYRNNLPGIAKLLIEKGADIHYRHSESTDGRCHRIETPLHNACNLGLFGIVQLLVKKGANLNEKDLNNKSPLHATLKPEPDCFKKGKKKNKMVAKIAIFLVEQGAKFDDPDDEGKTPLYYAAITRELEVAKILIDKGAKIKTTFKDNETLLHIAVKAKSQEIVELLIDNGADLNAKDKDGQTPLDIAKCYTDTQSIIEVIVRKMIQKTQENESSVEPSQKRPKLEDCLICFEPRSEIFMLKPCGHAKTCQVCCLKIVHLPDINSTCPVCRKQVVSFTKVQY